MVLLLVMLKLLLIYGWLIEVFDSVLVKLVILLWLVILVSLCLLKLLYWIIKLLLFDYL